MAVETKPLFHPEVVRQQGHAFTLLRETHVEVEGQIARPKVSESDLFHYILDWKKLWKKDEAKQGSLAEAIRNLEMLGWVKLQYSESLPVPA
ncbi:MAG: hypothetical protein Q8M07_28005 [Prosthecobacter sp.]|nr:hypothetical protein [Prosthecobacter sp.]